MTDFLADLIAGMIEQNQSVRRLDTEQRLIGIMEDGSQVSETIVVYVVANAKTDAAFLKAIEKLALTPHREDGIEN